MTEIENKYLKFCFDFDLSERISECEDPGLLRMLIFHRDILSLIRLGSFNLFSMMGDFWIIKLYWA
jgi:hypothetical protein